jgi:predicted enzyme related to lactoylglutathione lyase
VERLADGDAILRGAEPTDTIWLNRVPERKTVKHRVHLDVNAASLDPVVALGATVVLPASESGFAWTVMADPEGGEFCVFVRDAGVPADPPARLYELAVDVADAESAKALAGWWAEVLGGRSADDGRGFWWIEDIPGFPFDSMDIAPVPEPKAVKNRIHWDVTSDDLPGLLDRGATVLAEPTEATRWHVCADPQGNEFCVFPAS